MTDRYYVYAISTPDLRLPDDVAGFGGPLQVLTCGELAAVVSQANVEGGNMGRPEATAQNLLQHERVVEAVGARSKALPVRFGTLLSGAAAVIQALRSHYADLLADLRRLGDTSEMTVSVLRRPAAEPTGAHESANVAGDGPDPGSSAPAERRAGLAYLRGRQAVYLQAESARAHAQALARDLDAAFAPLALELRHSLCPSERLTVRAVYLIARGREQEFAQTFEDLRCHHPEVRLLMSGPWPPYSFVTARAQRAASDEEHISTSDARQDPGSAAEVAGSAVRNIRECSGGDAMKTVSS